jgi:hypothetical protein
MVIQVARLVVGCLSRIILPSQTIGNTNNMLPTMMDRFIVFESDWSSAHSQINKVNTKRVILKNNSAACFMLTSCDHIQDRPTVCFSGRWAVVDSAWKQGKLKISLSWQLGEQDSFILGMFSSLALLCQD